MKPMTAERAMATGRDSIPVLSGEELCSACVLTGRDRKWMASTTVPTATLTHAASRTEPDMPHRRMVTSAARRQAAAEPSVFTKYKLPTERPTLPEIRERWATNMGRVAPISVVGTRTKPKEATPVSKGGAPAV